MCYHHSYLLNSIFYFCLIDEGTKGQELKKKIIKLVQLANDSQNWSPSWPV